MTDHARRRRADRGHPRRHPAPPAVRPLPRAHQLPVHQAQPAVGDPLGHADRVELRRSLFVARPQLRHRLRGRHLVAGADGARAHGAHVADVRDLLAPLGFTDAKVSILSAPAAARASTCRRTWSPTRSRRSKTTLATLRRRDAAPTCSSSRSATGGTFTFTAAKGVTPTEAGVKAALADDRAHQTRRSRSTARTSRSPAKTLPASPTEKVAAALAKYAGADGRTTSASRPSVPRGVTR